MVDRKSDDSENSDFIPFEKTREGLKKCHAVVNRLITDAELLLKHGRYSSATALAILAYEETSKANELRMKAKTGEGISIKDWKKMSSGRGSHEVKLTNMLKQKEERVSKYTPSQAEFLKNIDEFLGLPYVDLTSQRSYISKMKKIFPKFNFVKQDCFYLDWDEENQKWSYFDSKFNENTKKAIAHSIILEVKHTTALQKFVIDLPKKPFVEYTKEEWEKIRNLKSYDELKKISAQFGTRESIKISNIALSAIETYKNTHRKGQ